jgi:Na+/melibiose symporter-like transporter
MFELGYFVSAIVIGLSLIPGPVAYSIFIKDKKVPDTVEEVTNESGLRRAWNGVLTVFTTFKNRGFVIAMSVYFLCLCSINFIQNNLLLYMNYVLHRDNHFQWFILIVQVDNFGSTTLDRPLTIYYIGRGRSIDCYVV